MAKKKATGKKTVKKAAPKVSVNKTQEIKKALAATPRKSPKEISDALTAKGVAVTPGYVSTIKTNLKAKAPKKVSKKKVAAKKKPTKKRTPKATPATNITFEQLRMAKEMAQQLGGIEKAKETLAALSELATD
jgi:hypothetical protein